MKNKISKNTELFFKYTYKGAGKYYTTEQGSRSYRNTTFYSFFNKNRNCVDVISDGNDAPRGGKTGYFLNVKFNKNFFEKWGWYLQELEDKKKRLEEYKAAKAAKIATFGDQAENLKNEFSRDPEFLEKILNRINNFSSKNWRNWVKMKVCQRITGESFEMLNLSPAEIRDIANEVKKYKK